MLADAALQAEAMLTAAGLQNVTSVLPNLYVNDVASMSSCGVVNPSVTFMALTARAADHAAAGMRGSVA